MKGVYLTPLSVFALSFVVVCRATTAAASVDDVFAAAAAGDAAKIERLLRPGGGYPPNSVDRLGRTPLLIAIFNGHEQAVRALVDGGANVNYATADGDTPLMAAAFRGNQGIVCYLLQKGADPSRVNRDGQTARDVAGLKGYADIADLLASGSRSSANTSRPPNTPPSPRIDWGKFNSLSPTERAAQARAFLQGRWCAEKPGDAPSEVVTFDQEAMRVTFTPASGAASSFQFTAKVVEAKGGGIVVDRVGSDGDKARVTYLRDSDGDPDLVMVMGVEFPGKPYRPMRKVFRRC